MQAGFDHGRNRVAFFIIDANHLLRVPVLRPTDIPFLDRRRSVLERQHQAVIDPLFVQHLADQVASSSHPTPPMSRTSAPKARSIVATLAAPPSRCSQ